MQIPPSIILINDLYNFSKYNRMKLYWERKQTLELIIKTIEDFIPRRRMIVLIGNFQNTKFVIQSQVSIASFPIVRRTVPSGAGFRFRQLFTIIRIVTEHYYLSSGESRFGQCYNWKINEFRSMEVSHPYYWRNILLENGTPRHVLLNCTVVSDQGLFGLVSNTSRYSARPGRPPQILEWARLAGVIQCQT